MFVSKRIVMLLVFVFVLRTAETAEALKYSSFIFSTYDIVFFSYEDGTVLEIYEKDGSVVLDYAHDPVIINGGNPLDKGKHVRLIFPFDLTSYGKTYLVTGSKKFSVLTGDPMYGKSGYYAMDQNGRGVSTEFYTYVPPKRAYYGTQKFIVFAYEDGTEITVEYADPNWIYHEVIADLPLDDGGYWDEDLSHKYVHVTSNKPVSALSCYDMGYFVKSDKGKFSKRVFLRLYREIGRNFC